LGDRNLAHRNGAILQMDGQHISHLMRVGVVNCPLPANRGIG
jgi:hypothetical protein